MEEINDPKYIFQELCSRYTKSPKLINRLWEEIETAYSEPKRYYHNMNHLQFMLREMTLIEDILEHPDSFKFSIFYHDIVYNAKRKDNEKKSAELAQERLAEIEFPQIEKVKKQIEATAQHASSGDNDINFLLDIDLGILGQESSVYWEYTKNVRKEYSMYPYFLYKKGRKSVILHFLKMEQIYSTAYFHAKYESQARLNLQNELERM